MAYVGGDLSPLISRLTRQLPPEGKPSLRRANMANMALHCELPLRSAIIRCLRRRMWVGIFAPVITLLCSTKGLLQKGFPSGGRKLQAVCRASD